MVSENNGGDGIHYLVVEIVATVLSWTGIATPVVRAAAPLVPSPRSAPGTQPLCVLSVSGPDPAHLCCAAAAEGLVLLLHFCLLCFAFDNSSGFAFIFKILDVCPVFLLL